MTVIRGPSYPSPASRFERHVWVGGWVDTMQAIHKTQNRIKVRSTQIRTFAQRQAGYHGVTKRGEMYQIGVSFALENEGVYSEPLPNVEGNRLYQIRMALAQYQAFPLVMGWGLSWGLPAGWAFMDGLGGTTYDEFVSNPTVVTRIIKSPANPAPSGFQIIVLAKYA